MNEGTELPEGFTRTGSAAAMDAMDHAAGDFTRRNDQIGQTLGQVQRTAAMPGLDMALVIGKEPGVHHRFSQAVRRGAGSGPEWFRRRLWPRRSGPCGV